MSASFPQYSTIQQVWFTAIVEDVADPLMLGRVRARALGIYNEDKSILKTEDLPWFSVVCPITSASTKGVGVSPTGLMIGSVVVGFFRDGMECQDGVILGTLHGLESSVELNRSGAGVSSEGGSSSVPRDAIDENYAKKDYDSSRVENVNIADVPAFSSILSPSAQPKKCKSTWEFPRDVVRPLYPLCSSFVSRSGHVITIDDTDGYERLHRKHRTGTEETIDNNGNRITTIRGNDFKVVVSDENVLVEGSCNLTINGSCRTLVRGDYILEVDGNKYETIRGTSYEKHNGSIFREVGQSVTEYIAEDHNYSVGKNRSNAVTGNMTTSIGGSSSVMHLSGLTEIVIGERNSFSSENSMFASSKDAKLVGKNTKVEGETTTVEGSTATNINATAGKVRLAGLQVWTVGADIKYSTIPTLGAT